jgi:hypothetical protein
MAKKASKTVKKASKKASKTSDGASNGSSDASASSSDLATTIAQARTEVAKVRAMFPDAQEISADMRKHSTGKIGPQESQAMRGVLDAIDYAPALFESLADKDDGVDPNVVETDLLRQRLDEHDLWQGLADDLENLQRIVSDQALLVGSHVAPCVRAAYFIAKTIAKTNEQIRIKIAAMSDVHAGKGRKKAAPTPAPAPTK